MRASFKPFFLGILFTSITWSLVLYFYVSHSPNININSVALKHSAPYVAAKDQSIPEISVINNSLDEIEDRNQKPLDPHLAFKVKPTKNGFGADVGLVRNSVDQKIREEGYSRHAFNVLVSSRLDYHRTIPDSRHKM